MTPSTAPETLVASSGSDLWDAGIRELVCVIPPDAELHPLSKISPASRGKVPGRRGPNGTWAGSKNWQAHYPTSEEVERWDRDGANAGALGRHWPAFDLDVDDEPLVGMIAGLVEARLGVAVVRESRHPRRLYAYPAAEPGAITKHRLTFMYEGKKHGVDLLGDGNQWVAAGRHPSGSEYRSRFMNREHPGITAEQALALLEEIAEFVVIMGGEIIEQSASTTNRKNVDQDALKGTIEEVTRLVGMTPNKGETREEWIKYGAALKGATQDYPEAGIDLWVDWCNRWDGGRNSMEEIEEAWSGLKPPYALGIDYLRQAAGLNMAQFEFGPFAERPQGGPPNTPGSEGAPQDPGGDHDGGREVEGGDVPVYAFSDQRLARELLHQSDEFAHAAGVGWFVWDGVRWVPDHEDKRISTIAQDFLWEKSREAFLDSDLGKAQAERIATRLASKAQVSATLGIIEKRLAFDPESFDADPDLLNTPAGVVDLTTGEVMQHDRDRRCSKVTEVGPTKDQPMRWLQFLEEVTQGDPEFVLYLQKMMGYSITGHTKLHAIQFITGPGGNGKSVFVETITHVLGDYAAVAPQGMFMQSKWDRHPADIASLMGARLVTSSETQAGGAWDEARVKAMTGGERMSARFMRQDYFTFTPRFKLVMTSNHQPAINNLDPAWRRRMHVIPFEFVPPEPDPDLMEVLRAEGPAILQWLIDGAVRWHQEGVEKPRVVLEATDDYFDTQNPVGQWLSEAVEIDPEGFATSVDLISSYGAWTIENHESSPRLSKKSLTTQIRQNLGEHVVSARSSDPAVRARGLKGIRLIHGSGSWK